MTDRELHRLSRKELLELLISQTDELERMRGELKTYEAREEEQAIKISKAGSIAVAALELNGVFEAAQAAAEQYLLSVRQSESDCEQRINEASVKAQQMIAEAEATAKQTVAEAEAKAGKIVSDAEKQAEETKHSAAKASEKYWDEVSHRLERFYNEHLGLRELVNTSLNGK